MLKTYLYIPEQLEEKIDLTARTQKKSKAEVMRQALEKGLNIVGSPKKAGVEALIEIADLARKNKIKGPRDASINHDYYLWGLAKKNPRIKP